MRILILLLIPLMSHASPEIEDAKRSVRSLIQPLLGGSSKGRPKGTEKFRVDACEKKKVNWTDVLLMRTEVTLEYKFKTGCDIQGIIKPKAFQPFPVSLDLRNVQSYKKITAISTLTASLETKPILNLEVKEGILKGKDVVKFEMDYQVQMNPLVKNPIEKNLGGELRITEINGKKTSIKEKILVK